MGWSWLFPSVSTFVASEYNIIDKSLAPIGKDFSTPSHHVPVFCSLYILSPLYFNNMIFISKYNKYNIIHNRYNYLQFWYYSGTRQSTLSADHSAHFFVRIFGEFTVPCKLL